MRKSIQGIRGLRDGPLRIGGTAVNVVHAPKSEPRIIRYELSDYEWTAITPMLPNKTNSRPTIRPSSNSHHPNLTAG